MTSERARNSRSRRQAAASNGGDSGQPLFQQGDGQTTGRYLVLMAQDTFASDVRSLASSLGVGIASASDFAGSAIPSDVLAGGDLIAFDKLAVAVVSSPPGQGPAFSAAQDATIMAIEEERVVYTVADEPPIGISPLPPFIIPVSGDGASAAGTSDGDLVAYLRGYQDAVNHLVGQLLGQRGQSGVRGDLLAEAGPDESGYTWGLQTTNVTASRLTGKGVRVAVLDTGFDLGHPDFVGRAISAKSFIDGETEQDGNGHGTHCIGTACGPLRPGQLPRYGIAYEAEIYVGKVLNNQGTGTDASILAGIEWAITSGCPIVSMSLGAPTSVGQPFSQIFETVARRALSAGTLIVSAAGNNSSRPLQIRPVGHPANCPSIMAVAALDPALTIAPFSSGGLNLQGGQVDIAGPGVNIYSSWIRPASYRRISGTSMATPHVAGIAALIAEANPDVRGGALGWLLLQSARRLDLPTRDIGAGLVQAP